MSEDKMSEDTIPKDAMSEDKIYQREPHNQQEPRSQQELPSPKWDIVRLIKIIFGSSVGVILATILLATTGTNSRANLFLWVACTGLGPLAISVLALRRSPKDFGFAMPSGPWKKDLALVLAITIPLMIWVASMPTFQAYYSVHYNSFAEAFWGLAGQTAIYYFFEEFLFHGFMFFGLLRKVGKGWATVWVSLVFTVLHIGKPGWELLLAGIYSIIFCWLSMRSKSFFSAAIVHFVMSLVVNILVAYVWLGPAAAALTNVKY
jgi:membrane protease YdiL (CAAX protease family)